MKAKYVATTECTGQIGMDLYENSPAVLLLDGTETVEQVIQWYMNLKPLSKGCLKLSAPHIMVNKLEPSTHKQNE